MSRRTSECGPEDVTRLSPLVFDHIDLLGPYAFSVRKTLIATQFSDATEGVDFPYAGFLPNCSPPLRDGVYCIGLTGPVFIRLGSACRATKPRVWPKRRAFRVSSKAWLEACRSRLPLADKNPERKRRLPPPWRPASAYRPRRPLQAFERQLPACGSLKWFLPCASTRPIRLPPPH